MSIHVNPGCSASTLDSAAIGSQAAIVPDLVPNGRNGWIAVGALVDH